MRSEEQFYKTLAQTPELPPELYHGVRSRIVRHNVITRTVWTFAAMLVIATGAAVTTLSMRGTRSSIEPEIADELQSIRDYFNGSDITTELNTYADNEPVSF